MTYRITLAISLWASSSVMADSHANQIDQLMRQWSELEQQRNRLETQWRSREAILQQQSDLLDTERKTLLAVLEQDSSQQSESEQERTELLARQIQLEQEQQSVSHAVGLFLQAVLDLHEQLPPPLQTTWQETLSTAQAEQEDVSQQLELVLRLLAQAETFNQRIALYQDVMTFGSVEVKVHQVYLGLSRGWYVDAAGQYSGFGYSSPAGWQWQTGSDASPLDPDAVLQVVHMLQQPGQATLTGLPVQL